MVKHQKGITKGRTCLILKDDRMGNETSNFSPITCLPIMQKIFTGILAWQNKFMNVLLLLSLYL